MKKIIYLVFTAILFFSANLYSQDKKTEQLSDSAQSQLLKNNLIKFYNKFISYQRTADYKSIIRMNNAPKQDETMRSKIDSIAKLTGFKDAKDFFNTEELMRRDPKVKQYSDRIAKYAKAIEADTIPPTPVDSALIKETTKKLVSYYTQLEKWTNTPEFKALKELNDKKKIQEAIKNKENDVSQAITKEVAAKFTFLEMKYKIRDKEMLDIKKKYKIAISSVLPVEEKKDIPRPRRPLKTDKAITPELKTK